MGMLNKEDLRQIGELFEEKFDKKFDQAFDRKFDQAFDRKFDQAFDRKFAVVKKDLADEITDRVVAGVGEMMEENILPQFNEIREEMKTGFDRLDRRLDRTDGKVNAMVNLLTDKRVFTQDEKAFIVS
jgi:hypothetical protein